ncbi:hypothetical protein L1077_22275 [Pseudoalteromonas luteoviolacea]|uniref:hypothetical protein n=1 Tax=Pseudoalteromonas luteoviolacea TaxID=43657 RepID=UPI001F3892ED|nr:hypothetical protein [Pseudoalteromonas luteoviolacea]MCF6442156.1 hypothetical protein [Pseudoalteromonas luteoviolacea]
MKLASMIAGAIIALSTATSMTVSAKSVGDFAYYHIGCYGSGTNTMLWYEIAESSAQIRSIIQRCTSQGGDFRIQKIYTN